MRRGTERYKYGGTEKENIGKKKEKNRNIVGDEEK